MVKLGTLGPQSGHNPLTGPHQTTQQTTLSPSEPPARDIHFLVEERESSTRPMGQGIPNCFEAKRLQGVASCGPTFRPCRL